MTKGFFIAVVACALAFVSVAQKQTLSPTEAVSDERQSAYFLEGASVYNSNSGKLEKLNILIQNGKILQVGTQNNPPRGSIVLNMQGKFIYPSFIELHSDFGLQSNENSKSERKPYPNTTRSGPFGWNEALRADVDASTVFKADAKKAEEWRSAGFGLSLSHVQDGIARGSGALIHMHGNKDEEWIFKQKASAHFSFRKGSSKQDYPSSLMGAIALLRQAFIDADWYAQNKDNYNLNLTLEALQQQRSLLVFFELTDYQDAWRADAIGDEAGLSFVMVGTGEEYKRAETLKNTQASFVLPLNFPKAPEMRAPYVARDVSLEEMKHWELAPANAAILNSYGIQFAFTTKGLKNKSDLLKNIRKACAYGLPENVALDALTRTPAMLLKLDKELGSIENGKFANFIVMDNEWLNSKAQILENWVAGNRYEINKEKDQKLAGKYRLVCNNNEFTLHIQSKGKEGYSAKIVHNSDSVDVQVSTSNMLLAFTFTLKEGPFKGLNQLNGKQNFQGKILDGRWENNQGELFAWSAIKQDDKNTSKPSAVKHDSIVAIADVWIPNRAFGYQITPKQESYFIHGATLWTNDSTGVFKGDVVVKNGKIAQIGKYLNHEEGQVYIEGKNMHLTPGLIDEHSHIAIARGVNDGARASSAQVRIGDVINPDDINIYRQLAGGVTSSQLLHGSANPIGGQSALIKLKWGCDANEMKIKDAPGFIKFALGENVKQSNWGDHQTVRFPQSRMGVEQVYYDYFTRAKAYTKASETPEKGILGKLFNIEKSATFRRDLELEALAEILNQKRFITCHSYVQSEINMLMHVADSMGFTVNTFTHILEGYKLADKLKKHGANASTFADWWAYKFEVNDAIPYNAAMLTHHGVNTGINSDDAEMGRRLNQEAAKAVKYGGASEEEALKMVTLNPAKMLHLDHRIGKIAVGMDADLVLWSAHPLSIYAKSLLTMIEGVVYYSDEQHQKALQNNQAEKNRLTQKIIDAANKGEETQKPSIKKEKHYHCDTLEHDWLD